MVNLKVSSFRLAVYNAIRDLIGLSRSQSRDLDPSSKCEEPAKKRRSEFLDRLEDCSSEDDELDCYLRTSFPPHQTKSLLEFWSSIGERQFPRLAKLARFLLATSAASSPLMLSQPSSQLTAGDLGTLLILRWEIAFSITNLHEFLMITFTNIHHFQTRSAEHAKPLSADRSTSLGATALKTEPPSPAYTKVSSLIILSSPKISIIL